MRNTPSRLQLTERDLRVLRDLFETRLITIGQAAALYFGGASGNKKTAYAKAARRLAKLADGKMVRRREIASTSGQAPVVYLLGRAGFEELRQQKAFSGYTDAYWENKLRRRIEVSDATLLHEVAVMDVKAALVPALGQVRGGSLIHFGTWPDRYAFDARWVDGGMEKRARQKPDGFFRFTVTGHGHFDFFIEVDRGTESLKRIMKTAELYRTHYAEGGFLRKYGKPGSPKEKFPFRVLFIALSPTRRNNMCESMLYIKPNPIWKQTWFATLDELIADPLGRVWVFPKAYGSALVKTEYQPTGRIQGKPKGRDDFVEKNVRRFGLLEDPTSRRK